MASSSTRLQLITEALAIAGRDAQIRSLVEGFCNRMLRSWALEYKYPILKTIGAVSTLNMGSATASIPSDLGAGMDNLTFGDDRMMIFEKSMDEFVQMGGFTPVYGGTGRPMFYFLDRQAGLIRFNVAADQAYTYIPVYYRCPPDLPTPDSGGDASKVWMDDDELVIQGLVLKIYQYTVDPRETFQEAKVRDLLGKYRQGTTPEGGGQPKIQLSRSVFRRRRF